MVSVLKIMNTSYSVSSAVMWKNSSVVGIVTLLYAYLVLTHVMACGFFWLGRRQVVMVLDVG